MMLSNSKKILYKDIKKKFHLLVLISKLYLSLRFGYFWDTLKNVGCPVSAALVQVMLGRACYIYCLMWLILLIIY